VDFISVIDRLALNAGVLQAQVQSLTPVQAKWQPAPGKWSILEVINHLGDEETEDFRMRLQRTLEDPSKDWPPIDPEAAATERRYNERDLQKSFNRFAVERASSVAWLRSLPETIDWRTAHAHPRIGVLRAGDLLCSWLAHDLIHIRQINRLHYEYFTSRYGEFSTGYAGNW
jgi:hypothetical protein